MIFFSTVFAVSGADCNLMKMQRAEKSALIENETFARNENEKCDEEKILRAYKH